MIPQMDTNNAEAPLPARTPANASLNTKKSQTTNKKKRKLQ
jgi:hypothetical protein